MGSEQSSAERELAERIIQTLNLEEVEADSIEPEAPLFGDGLGLDSIDALEMSLMISKQYGIELRSDDPEIKNIFASLRSLTQHIEQHRTK